MSQITTHVLDTSIGKPAEGLEIALQMQNDSAIWETIAAGKTNSDGRIADLLAKDDILEPGVYRMHFNTGAYFEKIGVEGFYPEAAIVFKTTDKSHYHIPLLLNPFGYSTYRGS